MNPANDRTPAPGSNGGNKSGQAGKSKIPQFPATPWLRQLGCPAGCLRDELGIDHHECGVGAPIPDLPSDDAKQRGGRDLDWQHREWIGARILDTMRGAA